MADVDAPPPKPNRKQRRAQAVMNRKTAKKFTAHLEADARRRFEKIKKMQLAQDESAVSDYTFG